MSSKIRQVKSDEHSNWTRGYSTAVRVARQVARGVLLLVVVTASAGFGPPLITDGGYPPLRLDPDSVQALWQSKRPPAVTAAGALVMDLDSGQILYSLKPEDRLPPASTVKIMTALVTLQRAALDDVVEVSAKAAGMQGSRMDLVTGEKLTVRELLFGLLLPSGNDAAVALAEHVAGDEEAFVALMNDTAASLDLQGTHFSSPHGLDNPDETVSAADLAILTRAALTYPEFSEIVATPEAEVAGRKLVNTNQLLGTFAGADGVKTGTTDSAGECLVASATRSGHRLLVVLLGSRDRYGEASALLNWANNGWKWRSVALPDNALAWEIGPTGQRYRLLTAESRDTFLPAWQWPLARVDRQLNLTDPVTNTSPVGTLTLTLGGSPLTQLPLGVWVSP
jgi:serine-type D-Ala-D-Ala carboxypeptidase (penicillin-binding protein 5/6)